MTWIFTILSQGPDVPCLSGVLIIRITLSNDSPHPPSSPPQSGVADPTTAGIAAAAATATATAAAAAAATTTAKEKAQGKSREDLQHQINHLVAKMLILQQKYEYSEGERRNLSDRVQQLEEWTGFLTTLGPDIANTLAFRTQAGNSAFIPASSRSPPVPLTAMSHPPVGAATPAPVQVANPPPHTMAHTQPLTPPPSPLNHPTMNPPTHNAAPTMPPTPLEQPTTELFISKMNLYDREKMLNFINERVDFNLVLSDVQPLNVKNGSAFNIQVPTEKVQAVLAIFPDGITAELYKRLGSKAFHGQQNYNQGPPRRNLGHPRRNHGPPRHHRGSNRPRNGGPNLPNRRGNPHQQTQHHQTQQYERYPPTQQQRQQQQTQRYYPGQQGDSQYQYQDQYYSRWNDQQYHHDRYYYY